MKIEWKKSKISDPPWRHYFIRGNLSGYQLYIAHEQKEFRWEVEDPNFNWSCRGVDKTLKKAKKSIIVSICSRERTLISFCKERLRIATQALDYQEKQSNED